MYDEFLATGVNEVELTLRMLPMELAITFEGFAPIATPFENRDSVWDPTVVRGGMRSKRFDDEPLVRIRLANTCPLHHHTSEAIVPDLPR